jgi:hypothetical protein
LQDKHGEQFKGIGFAPGVSPGNGRYPVNFLGKEFEKITVLADLDIFEPIFSQIAFIPIQVKTTGKMIGGKMGQRAEGCCNNQVTPGFEQPGKFFYGQDRIWQMLQNLDTQDCIKRLVRLRN